MPSLSQIIAFLSGLGAGSVVTAIVQHWLQRRRRKEKTKFVERKAAFDGLLKAYFALDQESSRHNQARFDMWANRVRLVGSKNVVEALDDLRNTEPYTKERIDAHERLMEAMRKDLEVVESLDEA